MSPKRAECCLGDGQILRPFALPEAQVRVAPDHDRFQSGHRQRLLAILRQQSELARDLAAGQRAHVGPMHQHAPGVRRGQTRQRMQGQALAATVAAQDGQEFAALHRQRQFSHEHPRARGDRQRLGSQRRCRRVHGCSRSALQLPAVKPALSGSRLRVQRARSCSRAAPSTHSSTASAHS